MITIYKITNPAGGIYVGKTNNFFKRKWKHKSALKEAIKNNITLTLLQKSFVKYGG